MLIRFSDPKENSFQINSRKTPILIFFETQEEIDNMKKMEKGDCLIMIPKSFDEDTTKRIYSKLNSKETLKTL